MRMMQHIDSLLVASYGRVIVDEFQDCDVVQHSIVSRPTELLPVAVLGDPLQQIFTFNEAMPTWEDVQKKFQTPRAYGTSAMAACRHRPPRLLVARTSRRDTPAKKC